jgi:hypothetical protein
MKYYLWINETQEGPYEDWEILKKLTDKLISEDTLACEDGAPEPKWIKVKEIPAIRWSSNFAPKSTNPTPSFGGFESSIAYFSSSFGRVYLLLGIIGSAFTLLSGEVVFGFVALFGTVAVSVFFLGLGEIIRTLHSIRDELKNQRRL